MQTPSFPSAPPLLIADCALSTEVKSVRAAQLALSSGDAAKALSELAPWFASCPDGALAQEAHALRAMALCTLGRNADATPDLDWLSRMALGSPAYSRAAERCAPPQGASTTSSP